MITYHVSTISIDLLYTLPSSLLVVGDDDGGGGGDCSSSSCYLASMMSHRPYFIGEDIKSQMVESEI